MPEGSKGKDKSLTEYHRLYLGRIRISTAAFENKILEK